MPRRGNPTLDRNTWIKRLWQAKRGRELTPTTYLIGRVMLRRASKKGVLWPSQACLADDVGCSVRTVERATQALRALGLLEWQQRRLRWNRRATNLYRLALQTLQKKKEESSLSLPTAKMSDGSLSPEMAGALARLGTTLGVSVDQVMPWLNLLERP